MAAALQAWLPAVLANHGIPLRSVGDLSYIVVDEIVGDAVALTVSPWPLADDEGRLRFLQLDDRRSVTVSLRALAQDLHAGWLRRTPRVGDVFAVALPADVRSRLAAAGDELDWDRPLAQLLPGPVYDLTAEARKVAKLAFYAAVTPVVPESQARRWDLFGKADVAEAPAPVRQRVGDDQTHGPAGGNSDRRDRPDRAAGDPVDTDRDSGEERHG